MNIRLKYIVILTIWISMSYWTNIVFGYEKNEISVSEVFNLSHYGVSKKFNNH